MPVIEVECKQHGIHEDLVLNMGQKNLLCPVCGKPAARLVSTFSPVSGDGGPMTKPSDPLMDFVRGPVGSPQRKQCEKELREGRQQPLTRKQIEPTKQEWDSMTPAEQMPETQPGYIAPKPKISLEKAIEKGHRAARKR